MTSDITDDKPPTHERIAALRQHYGLTKTQMGKLLNRSYRHYVRYETGEREMNALIFDLLRIKAAATADADLQQKLDNILNNC